jgi:hypothetical protein
VGLYSNKPEEEKYWPKARGSSIRKWSIKVHYGDTGEERNSLGQESGYFQTMLFNRWSQHLVPNLPKWDSNALPPSLYADIVLGRERSQLEQWVYFSFFIVKGGISLNQPPQQIFFWHRTWNTF